MSFVIAAPDLVAMATEDLAGIGASLTAANAAAAVPTSGLLAAAGDEVSAAIAALFSSHGQQYQAMSAQAAAFHARFVQALAGAMGAYAAAEAAGALIHDGISPQRMSRTRRVGSSSGSLWRDTTVAIVSVGATL